MSVTCRMLYVFLAVYLLIPCKSCEAARKHKSSPLARPYSVKWHIRSDTLILTWRYSKTAKPPIGFYIQVQESPWGGTLGRPEFIHVRDTDMLSTDIQGLKPGTRYYVKVIAFSKTRSKASKAIKVSTRRLEFLEVDSFKASSITNTNAVFTWSHKSANIVHDLKFKIACDGQLKYHEDGKEVVEKVKFEHTCQGASLHVQREKVTTLLPNTLYTCSIVTMAGEGKESEPHSMIQFMTLPGKPLVPSPPQVIIASPDKPIPHYSFEVELYKTTDKYGPISHYVVYAVPVTRGRRAATTIPYTPIVPVGKLIRKAVSAHLASTVTDKLPFIVGTYEAQKLPEKLLFDGSSESLDFKPDTHYAFVVAAFTETKDPSELMYSLSGLSNPPVYIGPDMTKEWIKEKKPAAERFASIVIMTLITSITVLSFAVFIIVGLAYMKQKRYGSISFDEESDIEFYPRKSGRKYKGEFKVQKKAYHKLGTSKSGEFRTETRVDRVRKSLVSDELETRPNCGLFSVSTPPESPRHSAHPTSPLVVSKKEEHYVPGSHNKPNVASGSGSPFQQATPSNLPHGPYMEYKDSSVAANINIEDRLAFGRPLPKRRPYPTPGPCVQSYYTRTHPPGKEHPMINPPEPPPPPAAIRLGVKEGYVMPKEGMPKRTLVQELEEDKKRREKYQQRQQQQKKRGEEPSIQHVSSLPSKDFPHLEGGVIVTSNSAFCGGNQLLSDDDDMYVDALTCQYHGEKKK